MALAELKIGGKPSGLELPTANIRNQPDTRPVSTSLLWLETLPHLLAAVEPRIDFFLPVVPDVSSTRENNCQLLTGMASLHWGRLNLPIHAQFSPAGDGGDPHLVLSSPIIEGTSLALSLVDGGVQASYTNRGDKVKNRLLGPFIQKTLLLAGEQLFANCCPVPALTAE